MESTSAPPPPPLGWRDRAAQLREQRERDARDELLQTEQCLRQAMGRHQAELSALYQAELQKHASELRATLSELLNTTGASIRPLSREVAAQVALLDQSLQTQQKALIQHGAAGLLALRAEQELLERELSGMTEAAIAAHLAIRRSLRWNSAVLAATLAAAAVFACSMAAGGCLLASRVYRQAQEVAQATLLQQAAAFRAAGDPASAFAGSRRIIDVPLPAPSPPRKK